MPMDSPCPPVVRLEIPDLQSRLAQKRAEVNEAEAKLRLLKTGPRAEEIADQQQRIERALGWRDLARNDLERMHKVLAARLARSDSEIAKRRAEYEAAQQKLARAQALAEQNVVTTEQLQQIQTECKVCSAQYERL